MLHYLVQTYFRSPPWCFGLFSIYSEHVKNISLLSIISYLDSSSVSYGVNIKISFRFVKYCGTKGVCSMNRKLLLTTLTDEKIYSLKSLLVCLHFSSILVILAQKPRSLSGFGSNRSEPDWGIQFESWRLSLGLRQLNAFSGSQVNRVTIKKHQKWKRTNRRVQFAVMSQE